MEFLKCLKVTWKISKRLVVKPLKKTAFTRRHRLTAISAQQHRILKEWQAPVLVKSQFRSHRRWGLAISISCCINRLLRSYEWTATSLHYCSTSQSLCRLTVLSQSYFLMIGYRGNVTTPKRFSKKCYCVLTETRRHYTYHGLPLHKFHIKWNHWHTICGHCRRWFSIKHRWGNSEPSVMFLRSTFHKYNGC